MKQKKMQNKMIEHIETNKFGVKVRICCASCVHCNHEAVDYAGEYRKCLLYDMVVKQTDLHLQCYKMSPLLSNINFKKDRGHVKRQRYLKMVANVRERENKFKVKEEDCIPNEDLRERYRIKYLESVYMDEKL